MCNYKPKFILILILINILTMTHDIVPPFLPSVLGSVHPFVLVPAGEKEELYFEQTRGAFPFSFI